MSNHPDPEERELHALFTSLREHAVDVVEDVTARVMRRVVHSDQSRRPPPTAVISGGLIELFNLIAWLFAGNADDGEESDGLD